MNNNGRIDGKVAFELRATHGLPLDIIIDFVYEAGMVIDWVGFIEAGRMNKRYDYQTYDTIAHALVDSIVDKESQRAILDRCQMYIMKYPQVFE